MPPGIIALAKQTFPVSATLNGVWNGQDQMQGKNLSVEQQQANKTLKHFKRYQSHVRSKCQVKSSVAIGCKIS